LSLPGMSGLSFPGRRSRSSAATNRTLPEAAPPSRSTPRARAAPSAPVAVAAGRAQAGRFQVCLGNEWRDYTAEECSRLRAAVASGQRSLRMEARGEVYDCDLVSMRQVNRRTGKERAIRFIPLAFLVDAPPGPRSAVAGASSPAAEPQSTTAADAAPEANGNPSPAVVRSADVGAQRWCTAARDGAAARSQQRRQQPNRRASSAAAAPSRRGGRVAHAELAEDVAPRWLHVWVPNGPTFASGAYRLLAVNRYNGYPVWWKRSSSGGVDCFIFSTATEHWAIGGAASPRADDSSPTTFSGGLAWVYSPVRHFGQMPDQVPRNWQHNQPEWTTDRGIVFTEVEDEDAELLERSSVPTAAHSQKRGSRCKVRSIAAGAGAIGLALLGGGAAGDALVGDQHLSSMLGDTGGKVSDFLCSVF